MDTALPADHISLASDIHPLHLRLSFVRGRAQRVLLHLATSRRLHLLHAFPAHLDDRIMPNHVHARYSLYLYTVRVYVHCDILEFADRGPVIGDFSDSAIALKCANFAASWARSRRNENWLRALGWGGGQATNRTSGPS